MPDDEKHENALDLTEKAMEKLDAGDEAEADKLLGEAKRLDKSAVAEVVADLDEAAKN